MRASSVIGKQMQVQQHLPQKGILQQHLVCRRPNPGRAVATAAAAAPPSATAAPADGPKTAAGAEDNDGLRLVYEPPSRQLSFRTWNQRRKLARAKSIQAKVDIMLEGQPLMGIMSQDELQELLQEMGADAGRVMQQALMLKVQRQPAYKLPRMAVLSLVLCDDAHISRLNAQHRGKQGPTDVLSFEMDDELDFKVSLPIKLLGDMVISLDTAHRQAEERGYSLRDELRVLMVHGMLHLCGYDHEHGDEVPWWAHLQELLEMAQAEQQVMQQLGWQGQGLIAAVGADQAGAMHDAIAGPNNASAQPSSRSSTSGAATSGERNTASVLPQQQQQQQGAVSGFRKRPLARQAGESGSLGVLGSVFGAAAPSGSGSSSDNDSNDSGRPSNAGSSSSSSSSGSGSSTVLSGSTAQVEVRRGDPSKVQLVALDMDGTLLDSTSHIRPSSVAAIKAACEAGVRVILATGKARPAALRACQTVGLEGPNLLVHTTSPGIFLQGLAVHGEGGRQLADAQLPRHVVEQAFRFVQEQHPQGGVSLVAFTGDECVTLRMTDDLQALHHVYYEPLAGVAPSLEALLSGPPVRKLLFMSSPQVVDTALKPHWARALQGSGAAPMQAVPNMLEVVPEGVDKWVGARVLLRHLRVPIASFMAVGDGSNDLQLVSNAGIGVAMANAVPAVKAAAKVVVSSNDGDGIAEAFERFVL